MNKIIKTVAVLATGMVLTTGTAFAGPHHGGGIVRIARLLRLGIMSFTTPIITAGTPDGSRSAQRQSARLSAD